MHPKFTFTDPAQYLERLRGLDQKGIAEQLAKLVDPKVNVAMRQEKFYILASIIKSIAGRHLNHRNNAPGDTIPSYEKAIEEEGAFLYIPVFTEPPKPWEKFVDITEYEKSVKTVGDIAGGRVFAHKAGNIIMDLLRDYDLRMADPDEQHRHITVNGLRCDFQRYAVQAEDFTLLLCAFEKWALTFRKTFNTKTTLVFRQRLTLLRGWNGGPAPYLYWRCGVATNARLPDLPFKSDLGNLPEMYKLETPKWAAIERN
jgi:hypothetical protein